jgi:hypothetical protein
MDSLASFPAAVTGKYSLYAKFQLNYLPSVLVLVIVLVIGHQVSDLGPGG